MFVCFNDFFYGQKKIPQEGHSIDDSRTTFGSTLASFVTEIFHECCPFRNTPLPLINNFNLRTYEAHFAKKYGWRGTLTSSDTLVPSALWFGPLVRVVCTNQPLIFSPRSHAITEKGKL